MRSRSNLVAHIVVFMTDNIMMHCNNLLVFIQNIPVIGATIFNPSTLIPSRDMLRATLGVATSTGVHGHALTCNLLLAMCIHCKLGPFTK